MYERCRICYNAVMIKPETPPYTDALLDWDGCLADTPEVWLETYDDVLKREADLSIPRPELIASQGRFRAQIAMWTKSDEKADRLVKQAHGLAAERLQSLQLDPEILETLGVLGESALRLAIVTKSSSTLVRSILGRHNIEGYFGAVVGGNDVEESEQKPHRRPADLALAQLNGNRSRAVMIGDTEVDILTGQNAGIDTILYYPARNAGYHLLEELEAYGPTKTITKFRDIIPILLGGHS